MYAGMHIERNLRNICYIVADQEGVVKDISAGCILILGLELRMVLNCRIELSLLMPELFAHEDEFKANGGRQMQYTFPKVVENTVSYAKGGRSVVLNVWLEPLHVLQLEEDIGFIVRAELRQKKAVKSSRKKKIWNLEVFLRKRSSF
jgi:hypothetical protein